MAHQEPFFTAPNLITLSRVPLAALVWLRPSDTVYLIFLMALAGGTDALDGWVERRRLKSKGLGPESAPLVGQWLDPLCDKIFALSVIAAVVVTRRPPAWIVLLITAREIIQSLVTIAYRLSPAVRARLSFDYRASLAGKAATVVQFCAITAILAGLPGQTPLAVATGALGTAASACYVLRAWRAAAAARGRGAK